MGGSLPPRHLCVTLHPSLPRSPTLQSSLGSCFLPGEVPSPVAHTLLPDLGLVSLPSTHCHRGSMREIRSRLLLHCVLVISLTTMPVRHPFYLFSICLLVLNFIFQRKYYMPNIKIVLTAAEQNGGCQSPG